MKLISTTAAVTFALLSSTVAAEELTPLNFNGYTRGGAGIGNEGGANAKWSVNKIGRLGNENDFYGEFGFAKQVYNKEGATFLVDSMLSFWDNAYSDGDGTDTEVAQFNIQAKGLFDDKGIVLWAGKRYYQRHDIHITDFYYWDTSGLGGGIEHIQVGPGKLSIAVLQDSKDDKDEDGQGVTSFIGDIRYAGIPLWDKTTLEVGLNYNYGHEKNEQSLVSDDGVMATASIAQDFTGGFNKTVLQYATSSYSKQMLNYGSGRNFERGNASNNDATGFRIINWGVASLGENIEFGHQALYAVASDVDGTDTDDTAMSLVVRPMYSWNTHMRTIVEAGVFSETINDVDGGGYKFTLAQAWATGSGFWDRPEIRLYASYIEDSENDTTFNNENAEMSVGIQAEAWW